MDKIKELHIYSEDSTTIFDSGKYIIPLYQRAFAWEDKQLIQLIEDIHDADESSNYYMGSLIVADKGNDTYEVIDGQQRLTAFFLLLTALGVKVTKNLTFACRDKSIYTLEHLEEINSHKEVVDHDKIQDTIVAGIKILNEEISKHFPDSNILKQKLKNVVIFRIIVPEHTDLNHYFEIMNTRGEQLEQHDILKALLMGFYDETEIGARELFARVWEACSDMTGYVQMNIHNKELREKLFGGGWNYLLSKDSYNSHKNDAKGNNNGGKTINELIENKVFVSNDEDNADKNLRFESIIEFPYFLIHCLKVYVGEKMSYNEDEESLVPRLMNDKKLLETFNKVIKRIEQAEGEDGTRKFADEFIYHLLKMRFLFDKYIIKREFDKDNIDGCWSLKELNVSGQGSQKKPYYSGTPIKFSGEWNNHAASRHQETLMIQAALRVSYTSPKVMHWITEVLMWLNNDSNRKEIIKLKGYLERIAAKAVYYDYLRIDEPIRNKMGVGTPHIVFNYLDYLLWKQNPNIDFVFEFRNSVEHWYPQNPSKGTFVIWKDKDRFGNLCIIQRNVNSKFSNLSPESKKSTFKNMIDKGSLKLRRMRDLTVSGNQLDADANWRDFVCKEHEEEMMVNYLHKNVTELIKEV